VLFHNFERLRNTLMKKFNPHLKRLMLLFPPSTSLASWEPMVTTPMGIAYLGAAVREAGYEVSLLDTVCEDAYQETPVADHIVRFGLTYDQILDRVRSWSPDVVGLSCIFSNQWPAVRELTRRLKAADPDLIVLSGGAHPSFMSELGMNDAPLDFILRGESELSLLELLDRLKAGRPVDDVDGLVWRDDGVIRQNPKTGFIENLDALPLPAHDLLPTEKYFRYALPMGYAFLSPRNVPIVTSRGCPCSCTFCSSTHLWGRRYRVRSADNVLAEMDWLVEKFGVRELKFQDDNLTIDRERAKRIFQGMTERSWHLHWNTPNGIAVWTLDRELLTLAKASGCWAITMAIESGDQAVLTKLIRKPLKLDKVREVNTIARDLGIHRMAYFIIGFPGETRAQIDHTVQFARELRLDDWAIFIYNPLPGSELFEESVRRGYITEESFFETGNQYFSSVVNSEEWTAAELEAIIRREYLGSYLGIFRSPRLKGRVWYNYFRYRPSFLKFVFLRSARAFHLMLQQHL
jgi:magnesium-protoporphyrin IX monomethyl ester (oxidative) cyclase